MAHRLDSRPFERRPCRGLGGLKSGLAQVAGLAVGGRGAGGDVVGAVIADGRGTLHDAEATLHGSEKGAHGFAIGRDFDLHALVAFAVDFGVAFAALAVDVLRDIECPLMAFGAESAAETVDFVGIRAG